MEGHRYAGGNCAGAIGNGSAVERVFVAVPSANHPPAGRLIEAGHRSGEGSAAGGLAQWTILASGKLDDVAGPRVAQVGNQDIDINLGTTVSTA